MIDVPYWIRAKLCKCGDGNSIRYSDSLRVYVCKACNRFPAHLVRQCAGCGQVYLKNFRHPMHCSLTSLCWECLHDPMCEDLLCTEHEHFLTYTYPPGTNWQDFITAPSFPQPRPIDDDGLVSEFKLGV